MENKINTFPDYLKEINDVFFVKERLKEIDSGYRLYFNSKLKRVEVHNTKNIGDTLSVVCPYEKIDNRLLILVRQTRRERTKELIDEIEQKNAKIEKQNNNMVVDNARERAKEIVSRLSKKF